MFSFDSERPELKSTAEAFFDEQKAEQYINDGRINARQRCMAERVYGMLRRNDITPVLSQLQSNLKQPMLILDIGCGTGIGGEVIEAHGHSWLGCDISRAMLQQYKKQPQQRSDAPAPTPSHELLGATFSLRSTHVPSPGRATFGDVVQCDMGALLPFRANTFDACVAISSLQWLCYGEAEAAWQRMLAFFGSLLHCIKKDAPCVFQHYPEDNGQIQILERAALEVGFVKAASIATDTSFHTKHFLILNSLPNNYYCNGDYSYMSHWDEPPLNVLNTLLLGWKPDYRPAMVDDLPPRLTVESDEASSCLLGPGTGKTSRAHLSASNGSMQVEQHAIDESSAASVFCFDDIVEHIFYSMVMANVVSLVANTWEYGELHRDFRELYDRFESPLDWGTLYALASVSKRVRAACARLNYPALRTKVYQRLHDDWHLHPTQFPTIYFMQLEREEMTHFFIGAFLTGENPLLPSCASLAQNHNNHATQSLAGMTSLTGFSALDDPRALTTFWREALVQTSELFYLEQFLIWLQLFKYLTPTDHDSLAPPAIVWHIWTLYALSPGSVAAYQSLCLRYLGRHLALSDCTTINHIDLAQDYRTVSPKYRYRNPQNVFRHPKEYEWRMATYNHVLRLNGYADHFTWNPDACDPSCFGGKARVLLASGELCELRHVRVGDHVLSAGSRRARRVVAIRASTRGRKAMVRLNGFWITRGHPIWLPGGLAQEGEDEVSNAMDCASELASDRSSESFWSAGAWVRPDEVLPVQWLDIATLHGIYNLVLDAEHDALIYPEATATDMDLEPSDVAALEELAKASDSPTICCTLGRYCGERLARLHPRQNGKYGPSLVDGVEKVTA